jgi:hypothetical protein
MRLIIRLPAGIKLRENVRPADQIFQYRNFLFVSQIEARGELADPGIEVHRAGIGKVAGADLEHVGAVFREAARAGRPCEDAREVEHAYAFQRPLRFREFFRRRVADPLDLDERLQGDGLSLRMPQPLLVGTHVSRAAARRMDRVLERLARPRRALLLCVLPVFIYL